MEEKELQTQITELNRKVDILLDYVNQQRLKTNQVEDLVSDLSIVGKDFYDTAVAELDNRMIDLDPDQVKCLVLRVLRNIGNINKFLEIFESLNDFLTDVSPIFNEVVIDLSKKLDVLDKKGYFEFFAEAGKVLDNIITNYSIEDVRKLADNIVIIMDTVKSATQPEIMNALDRNLKTFKSIDTQNIPEYSLFRVVREMNKPEMKKAMGFLMTFLKSMESETNKNS